MIGTFRTLCLDLIFFGLIILSAANYEFPLDVSTSKGTWNNLVDSKSYRNRNVRSTDGECIFTENEMNGLVDGLIKAIKQPSDSESPIASRIPCLEALNQIHRLSNSLMKKFQAIASNNNQMSIVEFPKMEVVFENDRTMLRIQIDNTKRSAIQENKNKFHLIDVEIQNLCSKLTSAVNKMKAERLKYQTTKINQCIEAIINNLPHDAKEYFYEINDESIIGFIIESAYDRSVNTISNILKFSQILDSTELSLKVYDLLFKEMRKNYDLTTPIILIFQYRLDEAMKMPNYQYANQKTKNRFETLKESIEMSVGEVVNTWSARIEYSDYEQVTKFANKHNEELNLPLGKVVSNVLAKNVENAEKLLQFSRDLRNINQRAIVYEIMFRLLHSRHAMEKTHAYIMLAFAVKTAMEMDNYQNLSYEVKSKFEHMKNSFLQGVRNIIWASRVCLRNHNKNEYLYASGETRDDYRRYVYTWKPDTIEYDCY